MATKTTEEAPTSIRIGPAYMWRLDERGASTREERLAFMYDVAGMPGSARAKIGASRRSGEWTFYVRLPGQAGPDQHAQCFYSSKEAALEGLRAWLANNQL